MTQDFELTNCCVFDCFSEYARQPFLLFFSHLELAVSICTQTSMLASGHDPDQVASDSKMVCPGQV
jgi:hypothetical protein